MTNDTAHAADAPDTLNEHSAVSFSTSFLLPFVFKPRDGETICALDRLVQTKADLVQTLTAPAEGDAPSARWRKVPTEEFAHGPNHFDEREYLHPFTRALLTEQTLLDLAEAPWGDPDPASGEWPVQAELKGGHRVGGLRFSEARLHLFDIGVGLLAITVEGDDLTFGDLLEVNEGLRRTGRSYLAESLPRTLRFAEVDLPLFEQTEPLVAGEEPEEQTEGHELMVNGLVRLLLGRRLQGVSPGDKPWRVQPILDRRMVTLCWAAVPTGKDQNGATADRLAAALGDDTLWQRLLFVDGAGGCSHNASPAFVEQLAREHHYARWWRDHRIGFTRYSAAFLGSADDGFFCDEVRRQVRSVYYTMAVLTLLQRAKLVELSWASSEAARGLVENADDRELADTLRRLKAMFLLFASRYYFVEMTHQDQGIEMSAHWGEAMDNRRLFNELAQEIERFEAHQRQRAADTTNRWVTRLTIALTGLALWTGLLGANFLPGWIWRDTDNKSPEVFWVVTLIGVVIVGSYLVLRAVKQSGGAGDGVEPRDHRRDSEP